MDVPDKQGFTQRSTLQQVLNSTPSDSSSHITAKAQLDNEPPIPYCLEHIWHWFWELNSARNETSPISYNEIKAWSELKDTEIRRSEVTILKHLDNKYLHYINKQREKEFKTNKGSKK